MRYVFAGNRDIGVSVLRRLTEQGHFPLALMLPADADANTEEMAALSRLDQERIFRGRPAAIPGIEGVLRALSPDFGLSIHYPYIVGGDLLQVPRKGFLNLHPSYLPYNKGWHTPSWAILEGTPAGATLHFMNDTVDGGDVIHQKRIEVRQTDTADSLYRRLKALELEVFDEALDWLVSGDLPRKPQVGAGTTHKRAELFAPSVAELNLDETYQLRDLLRRLRALTTNTRDEACYFLVGPEKLRVTVSISSDEEASTGHG